MNHLEYRTQINAPVKKVWDTMLNPESYKEWIAVAWEDSYFDGSWAPGEKVKFLSAKGGGTLAEVKACTTHQHLLLEHIAVINEDGSEDRNSDAAKNWIGTKEEYRYTEKNGSTELVVTIECFPEWEEMNNSGWPAALNKLKEMCEK